MHGDQPAVVVVGSCNEDVTVAVEQLPRPGETVLGGAARRAPGGKGANQAVAAARLGSRVSLVGRVGDDPAGAALRAGLEAEGVATHHLRVTAGTATGMALIAVDATGENTIVVSPGANAALSPADVAAALRTAPATAVTLVQYEVPPDTVAAAITHAPGRVVVNPAPARPLPAALLARVDVLVPNRGELGTLVDAPVPERVDGVRALAARLGDVRALVVTLGAEGALVVTGGAMTHVPAPAVDAVDATGAGDAFCGALADALARGHGLVDATRRSVRAASAATTAWGAQAAMPTRAQLLAGG